MKKKYPKKKQTRKDYAKRTSPKTEKKRGKTTTSSSSKAKKQQKKQTQKIKKQRGIPPEFKQKFSTISKIPVLRSITYLFYKEGWFYSVGLSIILCLFFILGMYHLGKFMTTDETEWLHLRIAEYWSAILDGNWEKSNITPNPGILHCFLAGIPTMLSDMNNYSPANFEDFLFWWRFPGLFFNVIALFLIYSLLKNILNKNLSLGITGALAFTPFLLGISQVVNSDSQLWTTGFICFLSFIAYMKTNRTKYYVISGIFLALALLCKYAAVSLYLFIIVSLYLNYLFKQTDRKQFLQQSIGVIKIIIISLGVYAIFNPATILSPKLLIDETIGLLGKSGLYLLPVLFLIYLEAIALKGKISVFLRDKVNIQLLLLYIVNISLAFALLFLFVNRYIEDKFYLLTVPTPNWQAPFLPALAKALLNITSKFSYLILLSLLFLLVAPLIPKARKRVNQYIPVILYFTIAIILYKVGVSLQGVVSGGRYDILIFPIVTAIGVIGIISYIPRVKIAIVLVVMLCFVETLACTPLSYLFYNNQKVFKDWERVYHWGFGGYELAQKANKMQGAQQANVLADYHGFSHFFIGKTTHMQRVITEDYLATFDYLCLSNPGRRQKELWKMMTPPYNDYYEIPLDSSVFIIGDKKHGYQRLVKIDKEKLKSYALNEKQYLDTKSYIELDKSYSITFWMRALRENPGEIMFLGKGKQRFLNIKPDANQQLIFNCKLPKEDTTIIYTDNEMLGKWLHVVWYQKENENNYECGYYINGEKKKSITYNDTIKTWSKFAINKAFNGQSDDFRVYDFALNPKQIDAIYNTGKITTKPELTADGEIFKPKNHFFIQKK